MSPFHLWSYHYELAADRIAQSPAVPAHDSKLLVRNRDGTLEDRIFRELPGIVDSDRVMFFNNSEVMQSRIVLTQALRVNKDGQEKVFDGEVFFLEDLGPNSFKAMVYPGDQFRVGNAIVFQWVTFLVRETIYEGRILEVISGQSVWGVLDTLGQMPLPPYIEYTKEKESWYQTIFAEEKGSLAAPTASLHFTPEVIAWLDRKGIERHTVTLHVGMGTFKDIDQEDIRDYIMHSERAVITASIFETIAQGKLAAKTILAVGTTVTRTLESLPYLWSLLASEIDCSDETRIFWNKKSLARETNPVGNALFSHDGATITFSSALFIYGDYPFQVVDEMITNFHLPESTLFILVSTFIGLLEANSVYSHAIDNEYRFFSFGDVMYLKSPRSDFRC